MLDQQKKLRGTLFFIRITVFLVMFIWTLDKFVNTPHAITVYKNFYLLPDISADTMHILAGIEMVILVGFLIGFQKRITYGAVLIFHFVSTISAYAIYLDPFKGPNLLFFAAWPMLAACFALYVLRDSDTLVLRIVDAKGPDPI